MFKTPAALAQARSASRGIRPLGTRARNDAKAPLQAGLPRTVAALVFLPSIGVATGMHYSPEFRALVEERVPGATEALAKLTGASYTLTGKDGDQKDGEKSTLPEHFDDIPEILQRIENSSNKKTNPGASESAPETTSNSAKPAEARSGLMAIRDKLEAGASEAGANAEDLGKKVNGALNDVMQKVSSSESSESAAAPVESAKETIESLVEAGKKAEQELVEVASKLASSLKNDGVSGEGGSGPGTGRGASDTVGLPSSDDSSASQSKGTGSGFGTVDGERQGENGKFSRLFGRGDFDPSTAKGKDVVDPRVYEKPAWMTRREARAASVTPAPTASFGAKNTVPSVSGISLPSRPAASGSSGEVEALEAELKSQAKWDAVRLQEAVKAQSVADKKASAAKLASVSKAHKLELAKVKEQAILDAQKLVEQKSIELEARMEKRREAEVSRLLKERETALKASIESDFLRREREAAEVRQREFVELRASVEALHDDLDKSREHRKASQEACMVAASAFSLKDALQGSEPFAKELEVASKTSDLGKLVAESIPAEIARRGVPTVGDLKYAFENVSREGRKAALVPDEDVGTIWGHLLATVVSHVKFAVDYSTGFDEPKTDEERLRAAEKLMAAGDLRGAVKILEGLHGLSSQIVRDWMVDANARIACDLGAQALLADAILTQQDISGASFGEEVDEKTA